MNNYEKTLNDKFYESNQSNANIIQNNYYTTNTIYLNRYVGVKGQKKEPNMNFSYTTKKPMDKYQLKLKDKEKLNRKNEIKKNLLFRSFDISHLINNKNNKKIRFNSRNGMHSSENTFIDENDETIGRNIPH